MSIAIPSLVVLLSIAFGVAEALPWAEARETGVYQADEFSPRPTGVPEYAGQIFKRDWVSVNVCGWVGGRPDNVAKCGSGSSCIHDTVHGVVGCCATAGPCTDGVFTTCIDSSMEGWKSEEGLINNGILSCRPSSTCYQNKYSGDWKQFSCGSSTTGGEVQTTYDGQPKDMRLQVVYTGVNFSPMSRPPIATVPFNPTPTLDAPEASSTSLEKEDETGYIAGGTVGGIAVAAILIAGIILLLRRRKRSGHRVGGLVGLHHRPELPASTGPLKRLSKLYSPQDFGPLPRRSTAQDEAYMAPHIRRNNDGYLDPINEDNGTTYISPLTGHPDESHQQPQMREQNVIVDRDLLMLNGPMSSSTYSGAFPDEGLSNAVPISRLNTNHKSQMHSSPSPQLLPSDEEAREQQRQPLVGLQMDDFGASPQPLQSRNWSQGYSNLNIQNEEVGTQIHSGHVQDRQDLGLIGNMRRAATQMVQGNARTQDRNVRSESMRQSNPFSDEHETTDDAIWKSTPMNAPVLKEPDGLGLGLGFGSGNWSSLIPGNGESSKQVTNREKDKTTENRPLMEQMMEAFNAATRGVSGASSLHTSERRRESPTISSASAASRYGGMYAVPEEGSEHGDVSVVSSVGSKTLSTNSGSGLMRGQSNASLLRKPVGGSVRGHRASKSDS